MREVCITGGRAACDTASHAACTEKRSACMSKELQVESDAKSCFMIFNTWIKLDLAIKTTAGDEVTCKG